jgi:hypothetical protein
MRKKISRTIYLCILGLALVAVLAALRAPSVTMVPATAEGARSFDEKIVALAPATEPGTARTVRITAEELTSKLQQGLDAAPAEGGAIVLKAASVQLEGDQFKSVLTLDAKVKDLYLSMTGTLDVLDGRLQILPASAKLGSLPIPGAAFRRILARQFDSPATRDRLLLPEFIKDVRIENGELVIEGR